MKIETKKLVAGLYFVATPIGSARDITLRALDTLASADVLAAEDTRTLRKLMQIHGVPLGERQILAYHDHNGAAMRPKLLRFLVEGRSVAYASEAGTPLVADPGFQLARAAVAEGHMVTTAPGPSAVTAALSVAGLPTDRFLFAGFAPTSKGERTRWLKEMCGVKATLIIYETPMRIHRILDELIDIAGGDRLAALCRELTKRFEEVRRGTLSEIAQDLEGTRLKGEIVLLIDRDRSEASEEGLEDALRKAMQSMSVKDAAAYVSEQFGVPKRQVYQAALALQTEE